MRPKKERAIAHQALTAIIVNHPEATGNMTASERDLLLAAYRFTEPRPWWRIW